MILAKILAKLDVAEELLAVSDIEGREEAMLVIAEARRRLVLYDQAVANSIGMCDVLCLRSTLLPAGMEADVKALLRKLRDLQVLETPLDGTDTHRQSTSLIGKRTTVNDRRARSSIDLSEEVL